MVKKIKENIEKNMKTKGFTLSELLGSIIILGLIALITVPTVNTILKKSRETVYEQQVSTIQKSAQKYVLENVEDISKLANNYVSVETLKKNGYIEKKDVIDPRDDSTMNGCIVIDYKSNTKQYEYIYKETPCEEIYKENVPVIEIAGGTNINVEVNSIFTLPVVTSKDYAGNILKTVGPAITKGTKTVESVDTSILNAKYLLSYEAIDENLGLKSIEKVNVRIVDTTAPVIAVLGSNQTQTVNVKKGSRYTLPSSTVTDNSKEEIKATTSGKVDTSKIGSYKITYSATDSSGNKGTYVLTVNVLDSDRPIVASVTGNPTSWTNKDVTLTINGYVNTKDGNKIVAYSFDGGTTWQNDNTKTYSANTDTFMVKVKDLRGNISTNEDSLSTKISYIDKTAPENLNVVLKLTDENGASYTGNWVKENVWTSYSATDSQSGIDHYELCGNGQCETVSNPNIVTTNGGITKYVVAVDKAGNISSEKSYIVNKVKDFSTTGSCSTLTYNGSAQTLAKGGVGITYSNNSQTNAGTYTVTATSILPDYRYSDGSLSKIIECSIAKATPTVTLNPTSGTVVAGKTMTFTETGSVAGSFTNTSGTTTIATVSPASYSAVAASTAKTVTVTGVASGTSAVTVKFTPTDATNYNTVSKTYTATITKSAAIPGTSLCVARTYNGSAQQITSATSGTGYTLSGYSQTNAGTYTVTATLASGYRWSDNATGTKTFSCSISKATPTVTLNPASGTVVAGKTMTFTETGSVAGSFDNTSGTTTIATLSPASYSAVALNTAKTVTVTGVASGTSAVTVKFTPTDTTNYNTVSKTYTANITESATIPTNSLCVARTYNGSAQQITSATSGTGYTLSNHIQTNAGTYTVTATLASGYRWSDNATGTKTFSCSIAKATPTVTLNPTSGTVVTGKTMTFTETGSVAGSFDNTSGTTTIATVSPASYSAVAASTAKTVTVTGVASGTSAVTVKFTPTDTTNYNVVNKTYTATITKSAAIPGTSLCVARTYNGSAQQITNTTSGTGYTLSGYSQTNAGTYTVTATLASGYRWSDNATGTKTFSCSIAKATPTVTLNPTSGTVVAGKTMTFTETGSVAGSFTNTSGTTTIATLSPANYSAVALNTAKTVTVTGVASGTSTITVKFTPTDTTNYNTVSKTYTANITESATIPTNSLCVSRTYNGSAQQITSATSGTGYTLSNHIQTNAGTYTVTATLASGYRWSDNATGTKTFSCSIAKATPTVTLSPTSGTIEKNKTMTFTEEGSVEGNFANTSGTTSVATVSPASYSTVTASTAKTVTVTSVAYGASTITVKFSPTDTTNYNTVSKTYTATVKDMTAPTITLSSNGNTTYSKTASVTVTVKDATAGLAASQKLKYGWSTSSSTEPTSYTSVTLTNTAGTTSTTFSATSSGLTGKYYLWVLPDTSVADILGNATTSTVKSTGTFYLDNKGPSVTGSVPTTWTNNDKTITVTATDANVGTIAGYYISTETTAPTSSSVWQTSNTFAEGLGTYYIWAKDSLENISSSYATINVTNIDTNSPILSVSQSSLSDYYARALKLTITAEDAVEYTADENGEYTVVNNINVSGLSSTNSYQYYLSTSKDSLIGGSWETYVSGTEFFIGEGLNGIYYLFIKEIKDNAGNASLFNIQTTDLSDSNRGKISTIDGINYHVFGSYNFDNVAPTCHIESSVPSTSFSTMQTLTVILDSETSVTSSGISGPNENPYSWDDIDYSTNATLEIGANGTYTAYVMDASSKYPIETSEEERGNVGQCSIDINNIDVVEPIISLSSQGNSSYSKSHPVTVTISDNRDVDAVKSGIVSGQKVKYGWSESDTVEPNEYVHVTLKNTSGAQSTTFIATATDLTGKYYLWVAPDTEVSDLAGNITTETVISENEFYFDNNPPVCIWTGGGNYLGTSKSTLVLICKDEETMSSSWEDDDINFKCTNNACLTGDIYKNQGPIIVSLNTTTTVGDYGVMGVYSITGGLANYNETITALEGTVVDGAGNKSEAASITLGPINCSWDDFDPSSIKNGQVATTKLTCTSPSGFSDSTLVASDFTIGNSTSSYSSTYSSAPLLNSVTITSTNDVTNGKEYTISVKGTSSNGIAYLTLKAGALKQSSRSIYNTALKSHNIKVDNVKPSITITGDSTCKRTNPKATISLNDSGSGIKTGTYKIKYAWSSGSASSIAWDSISEQTISNSIVVTSPYSSSNHYNLYVKLISDLEDNAGNITSAESTSIYSKQFCYDITKPTITFGRESNTAYSKSQSVDVIISDNLSGLVNGIQVKYGWSESSTTTPTSWTTVRNYLAPGTKTWTFKATKSTNSGQYYLWVQPLAPSYLSDIAGNVNRSTKTTKGKFYLDNTAPVVYYSNRYSDWTSSDRKVKWNTYDAHVGKVIHPGSNTQVPATVNATYSFTKTYSTTGEYVTQNVNDTLGNKGSNTTRVGIDKQKPYALKAGTPTITSGTVVTQNCTGVGGTSSDASCDITALCTSPKCRITYSYTYNTAHNISGVVTYRRGRCKKNGVITLTTDWYAYIDESSYRPLEDEDCDVAILQYRDKSNAGVWGAIFTWNIIWK